MVMIVIALEKDLYSNTHKKGVYSDNKRRRNTRINRELI